MTQLPNIGLLGRKQTGKNTAGDYLIKEYGYAGSAFADPMREFARRLNPLIWSAEQGISERRYADHEAIHGYEGAKNHPEFRRTLQRLGTEAGRAVLGENVWIDAWFYSVRELIANQKPVVVTDVRFPNEADYLRELGFTLVRISRPGQDEGDIHPSETALDEYVAHVRVSNDGSLGALYDQIDSVVAQ